jgi:hypothetical protein
MRLGWLAIFFAVAGCGGNSNSSCSTPNCPAGARDGGADASAGSGDDAGAGDDAGIGKDGGAASNGDGGVDCTASGGTHSSQWVFDTITLPTDRTTYAYDLVGSGVSANQLGVILGALTNSGLDLQTPMNADVASGAEVTLLEETSTDPAFQTDACASTLFGLGDAVSFPPTANAAYTLDPTHPDGRLRGPVAGGVFSSAATAETKEPVTMGVALPFGVAKLVPLTVYGAHLQYQKVGQKLSGVVNGAIRAADVQFQIVPAIAAAYNSQLAADRAAGKWMGNDLTILTVFDNGGNASITPATGCGNVNNCTSACQNPALAPDRACQCAIAADGVIDVCEVSTSSTLKSVLAPDVQLFDQSGNWTPTPTPTMKDSLSIGFGFTAIPARF